MPANRLMALDAFRGLTLALMILVNTPGSWFYVYAPLRHAQWHGVTATDFIFPFFLFIVGASISFALKDPIQQRTIPWKKLLHRSLLLFVLGVLLNWFPFEASWDNVRIMGVLQRIALCYLFASIAIVLLPLPYLVITSLLVLIAYCGLLEFSSYDMTANNNIVVYFDLLILGKEHIWQGSQPLFEPEGLLSTIPATVTVISGYLGGYLFQQQYPKNKIFKLLSAMGLFCLLGAGLWSISLPFNKQLWSSSFVLLTSGAAYLVLLVLLLLEKQPGFAKPGKILQIYGSNPLLIYILSWLWAVCLSRLIYINYADHKMNAYDAGFQWLNSIFSPYQASLLFALANVLLFYVLSHWLFRKGIFVRL